MSEMDRSSTMGSGRLGFADEKDVDAFVETLGKFERGEITPDQWRVFRLLNGVYGQRQEDVTMLRIKIPQGIVTVPQITALADVAEQYSNGKGHITTRQNVQFHFVKWADADKALYHLAESGLTTKEACGNAVRNITQCPYAGISSTEPFDTSPYAEALTRFLLRGAWSSQLPRKFKIAFSGCCEFDCIGGAFHDIGYSSRVQNGVRGFRMIVGGGLSTLRRNAILVHDFIPAEEIFEASEAVVRVFHRTGDRKHRHKARLKFVIDKLKPEGFIAEYQKERENVRNEGGRPFVLPEPAPPLRIKFNPPVAQRPDAWRFLQKNVRPQRQPGYSAITVRVPLGDATTAQWRALAVIAQTFSAEEEIRLSAEQNLVIRFVRNDDVPAVHDALAQAGLASVGPLTIVDATSCPGTMSCKLAVTSSRGITEIIQDFLESRPDLVAKAEKLSIKSSGCPNSCGQHHVAGLGFQGGVKKVGGKALPYYHVYIGGVLRADSASFGRLAFKLPGRRTGAALEKLINLYDQEKNLGEEPNEFFARVDLARVKLALGDLTEIDEKTAQPEDFIDLGELKAFEVDLQEGECAA
jgi:sulfite reductase (NADPH) hemoprotein beta-component